MRLLNGSPHKKKTGRVPHVPLVTRWGPRRIKDIKRRDVRELLDEVAARAPIMYDSTVTTWRSALRWTSGGKRIDQIVSGTRSKVLAFTARA